MSCFFFDNCISDKIVEILKLAGAEAVDKTQLIHIKDVAELASKRGRGAADVDWIPLVAEKSWIAVTVDKRVKRNEDERALIASTGIRLVHIAGGYERLKIWDQVVYFVQHWPGIQSHTWKCKAGAQFLVSAHGKVTEDARK